MRLAILVNPETDFVWNPTNQYKLRGLIWSALQGTKYQDLHEQSDVPTFNFSNIFPVNGYNNLNETVEKDTPSMFLVSSPHPSLLDTIAADFNSQDKLEIGNAVFTIDRIETRDIDVGRIGNKGTLKTQTGLYLRLPPEKQEEYNLETPYTNSTISWVPEYGMSVFKKRLLENINWKLEAVNPTIGRTPQDFQDLFDSVSTKTTYQADVNVSEDYAFTFIPTVCEFDYTVTAPEHKKWLNTLLDTGLGWRTALGFGFLNLK